MYPTVEPFWRLFDNPCLLCRKGAAKKEKSAKRKADQTPATSKQQQPQSKSPQPGTGEDLAEESEDEESEAIEELRRPERGGPNPNTALLDSLLWYPTGFLAQQGNLFPFDILMFKL